MKAIILAAGVGTRLGDLGKKAPKCLLKLNNSSILEIQIGILARSGVKDVSVVVGVEGNCWSKENYTRINAICKNVILNEFNISKKRVYSLFKGIEDIDKGPIIVIDGDLFFEKIVVDKILESDKENLFLAGEVDINSSERKIVTDATGKIIRFGADVSVGGKSYVNAGMMRIGEKLFRDLKKMVTLSKNQDKSISNVLDDLCQKHELNVITSKDRWINLNTEEDLRRAQRLAEKKDFAVLWDLDGVIFDSEPLQLIAYKESFLNQGIEIQDKDYSENTGRKDMFQRICEKYNVNCNFSKWYKEKNDTYRRGINKGIKMLPGVEKLLKEIYKEKYRMALVSSTSKSNLLFILNKLNVRDYFEEIIGFEDTKKGKPDPEPYLKVAGKLNIEPRKCVVIEDTVVGIEAAKRAGMKCVAVTKTNRVKQDHRKADLVIGSLTELDIKRIEHVLGE